MVWSLLGHQEASGFYSEQDRYKWALGRRGVSSDSGVRRVPLAAWEGQVVGTGWGLGESGQVAAGMDWTRVGRVVRGEGADSG